MIELERHIEILLLSNDCVIVPGFGGFMAHHVDARYEDGEGLFLPPQRTIGFNPQLTLNDSLLAQSYIEAYDMSYPEALMRINDEVRELRQQIEQEGRYELNNIGVIALNGYGKYEFSPCEAGLLTPELYGLSSLEISPIAVATQPVATAKIVAMPKEDETDDLLNEEEEERTVRLSTIRNLAVACIALLVFLLVPSPVGNGNSLLLKSGVDTGMLYRIFPKDVVKGRQNVVLAKDTTKSDTTVKAQAANADTVAAPSVFYGVVLCSKVTEKNAKAYVERLHAEGYENAEVLAKGKNTKVIYGRYTTEAEAYGIVNKLSGNSKFKDCWVAKLKM